MPLGDPLIADSFQIQVGEYTIQATSITDGRVVVSLHKSGSVEAVGPEIQIDGKKPGWHGQVKKAWSDKLRMAQLMSKREGEESYNLDFLRDPT